MEGTAVRLPEYRVTFSDLYLNTPAESDFSAREGHYVRAVDAHAAAQKIFDGAAKRQGYGGRVAVQSWPSGELVGVFFP